jgi:hypothetical protein
MIAEPPLHHRASQLIGLIVIFIYSVFGLQFFADRAEVPFTTRQLAWNVMGPSRACLNVCSN